MSISTFLIFLAANDPFAAARADISKYCSQNKTCIAEQKKAMGNFVTMLAGFSLSKSDARQCMVTGKNGKYINWVKARNCMRAKVKGRPLGD